MASLTERKRARARGQLAAAALELIESHGFDATTIDQIAERAMVSKSTFMRYFGTKEEVLFASLPEYLEVLQNSLAAGLSDYPAWEAVARSISATLHRFADEDPLVAARIVRLWLGEPALRARYMEHADAWEQTIIEAVTASRGTDPATDIYAASIAVSVIGAFRIAVERFGSDPTRFTERYDAAIELMGAGLASKSNGGTAG